MKKSILIVVLFLGLHFILYAQQKSMAKADAYFKTYQFQKALNKYRSLAKTEETTYYASKQAALCALALHQPQDAEKWLRKALACQEAEPITQLILARVLFLQQNNTEATERMELYFKTIEKLPKPFKNYAEYIAYLDSDYLNYTLSPLSVNTPYSENSALLLDNDLIFSSNQPLRGVVRYRTADNNANFFRLYKAKQQAGETFKTDSHPFLQGKKNIHYSALSINPAQNIAYITQNQIFTRNKISHLTIHIYQLQQGTLKNNLGQLPFSSEHYSIAHPAVAPDGKTFYFASDMPGGYGGMDLYKCEIINGFLSKPQNMGPEINTAGNELFPAIAENQYLFFSSDGHPGKGGLDIWAAILDQGKVIHLFNPGAPINSSFDDFGLSMNEKMNQGLLVSNRPGGKGQDDLYLVAINTPLAFTLVRGKVLDSKSGSGIGNVLVKATQVGGMVTEETMSSADGTFVLVLRTSDSYELEFIQRLEGKKTRHLSSSDLKGKKEHRITVEF